MYRRKFLYSIFGVLFFVVYSYGIAKVGMYIEQQAREQPDRVEASEELPKFIVKEYQGVICLFVDGDDVPQKTLDIDVESLRQYDRERFLEGVKLNSLEQLAQLEEDFSS